MESGPAQGGPAAQPLSIGEVLAVLSEEFPDITVSKIRFLESQGLVQPERNASGYRQFGDSDIERLRWILRQQRDHFLPLKVIRRALERGVDVIDAGGGDQPTLWTAVAEAAAREEVDSERRAVARDEAAEARRSAARSGAHPARHPERHEQTAGSDGGSSGPGSTKRRHTSPADVVAALQEDPRRVRELGVGGPSADRSGDPAAGSGQEGGSDRGSDADPGGDAVAAAAPEGAGHLAEPAEHAAAAAPPSGAGGPPDAGRARRTTDGGTRGAALRGAAALMDGGEMRELGRAEFLAEAALDEGFLDELIEYGLLEPSTVAGEAMFDQVDLAVAVAARRSSELGISPRHLRMYRVAAVREAGLLEQVAMPLLKQRNPESRARAVDTVAELAGLGAEVHALLLARELGPHIAP